MGCVIEKIFQKSNQTNGQFFELSLVGKSSVEVNVFHRALIRYKLYFEESIEQSSCERIETRIWQSSDDYIRFVVQFGRELQEYELRLAKYSEKNGIKFSKEVAWQ